MTFNTKENFDPQIGEENNEDFDIENPIDETPQNEDDYFKESSENEDISEDTFFEEDTEEDEEETVKVKPKKVSTVASKIDEVDIKRVPLIGEKYKAPTFAIEVIDSSNVKEDGEMRKEYLCKVTWSTPPCKLQVGEEFTAKDVAFYSDYYEKIVVKKN